MALRRASSSAAVSLNARANVDAGSGTAGGRSAPRAPLALGRQPAAAPPAIAGARDATVPWLLVVIVIGAVAAIGVLIIVLARLVALPAVDPGFVPGPAPLSRSQHPGVEESETYDWGGPGDPTYVR
jgi:hypothetical protein